MEPAWYKVRHQYTDNIYLLCIIHMNALTNYKTSSDYIVEKLEYEADCDYCGEAK